MPNETVQYRVVCRVFQSGTLVRQSEPKSFAEANQEADAMRAFRDACLDFRGKEALPLKRDPILDNLGNEANGLLACFVAIRVEPVKS